MPDWKTRLYDGYVSTGQAHAPDEVTKLGSPYFDRLIANYLPQDRGIAIADLACGYGGLIYSLKKTGYKNILGVDISAEQVATAHRLGLTEVRCQDVSLFLREAETGSFDVVFLMDILEHLEQQETLDLLDSVNRITRPDGMVVIHVPNGEGIFGMRVRYGDFTHRRAFTSQSIGQVLSACGLHVTRCVEDRPVVHGLKSLGRSVVWELLTAPLRLLMTAESGVTRHILSQNMLVLANKSPSNSFRPT